MIVLRVKWSKSVDLKDKCEKRFDKLSVTRDKTTEGVSKGLTLGSVPGWGNVMLNLFQHPIPVKTPKQVRGDVPVNGKLRQYPKRGSAQVGETSC